MTGPEEVEATVAAVVGIRPDAATPEEVAQLLEAVHFLYDEYRWMHRCFTVATRAVVPSPDGR